MIQKNDCLNLPNDIAFLCDGNPRSISYGYDSNSLRRSVTHVTAYGFIFTPMASFPLLNIPIKKLPDCYITTTKNCGNLIYNCVSKGSGFFVTTPDVSLERILTEEGYITMNGDTSVYHYFLNDHLSNVRVVMNEDGATVKQSNGYYPFGGIFKNKEDGEHPFKFGGKEFDPMHGLNWSDFVARMRGNWRFMSIDPLCEKYHSVSPYAYCLNNPVKFVDSNGLSPIYGIDGEFLGTDDHGISGAALVIDKKDFSQGMSQADAQKVLYAGETTKEARIKMDEHVAGIPNRPDYDGVVTISEGIAWAKTHPGAMDNPTADNTLYLDASKINFGNLSVKNIGLNEGGKGDVNLFNFVNFGNAESRASTYALGNTQIQLLDASTGTVRLFTDGYDWDYYNPLVNGKP